MTEPAMNPKKNREQLIEVMFEKYGFEGASISIQAMLTLTAQGKHMILPCSWLTLFLETYCRLVDWSRGGHGRWRYACSSCV